MSRPACKNAFTGKAACHGASRRRRAASKLLRKIRATSTAPSTFRDTILQGSGALSPQRKRWQRARTCRLQHALHTLDVNARFLYPSFLVMSTCNAQVTALNTLMRPSLLFRTATYCLLGSSSTRIPSSAVVVRNTMSTQVETRTDLLIPTSCWRPSSPGGASSRRFTFTKPYFTFVSEYRAERSGLADRVYLQLSGSMQWREVSPTPFFQFDLLRMFTVPELKLPQTHATPQDDVRALAEVCKMCCCSYPVPGDCKQTCTLQFNSAHKPCCWTSHSLM